jgi:hypothetical protein
VSLLRVLGFIMKVFFFFFWSPQKSYPLIQVKFICGSTSLIIVVSCLHKISLLFQRRNINFLSLAQLGWKLSFDECFVSDIRRIEEVSVYRVSIPLTCYFYAFSFRFQKLSSLFIVSPLETFYPCLLRSQESSFPVLHSFFFTNVTPD